MTLQKLNDILVFRTVSIEKMDMVLDICHFYFSDARLVVLSSLNRRFELIDDSRVAEVITINTGAKGFPAKMQLSRIFRAVVIPLGNHRGAGYSNVFSAAASCLSNEFYTMPYADCLNRTSSLNLRFRRLLEKCLFFLAFPIAYLSVKMFDIKK